MTARAIGQAQQNPWLYPSGFAPYAIFLDDTLYPPRSISPFPWVVCRSIEHLIQVVMERGAPQFIGMSGEVEDVSATECAVWLMHYCEAHHCEFPKWSVHGNHPKAVMLKGELLSLYPKQFNPDGYLQ